MPKHRRKSSLARAAMMKTPPKQTGGVPFDGDGSSGNRQMVQPTSSAFSPTDASLSGPPPFMSPLEGRKGASEVRTPPHIKPFVSSNSTPKHPSPSNTIGSNSSIFTQSPLENIPEEEEDHDPFTMPKHNSKRSSRSSASRVPRASGSGTARAPPTQQEPEPQQLPPRGDDNLAAAMEQLVVSEPAEFTFLTATRDERVAWLAECERRLEAQRAQTFHLFNAADHLQSPIEEYLLLVQLRKSNDVGISIYKEMLHAMREVDGGWGRDVVFRNHKEATRASLAKLRVDDHWARNAVVKVERVMREHADNEEGVGEEVEEEKEKEKEKEEDDDNDEE